MIKKQHIVLIVCIILVVVGHKTPVTEFSQNILKTSTMLNLCLLPMYAYILVYKVLKKTNSILIIYQIEYFVIYTLLLFNLAFFGDYFLVWLGFDIGKIPSNIVAFLLLISFFITQGIYLKRESNPPLIS